MNREIGIPPDGAREVAVGLARQRVVPLCFRRVGGALEGTEEREVHGVALGASFHRGDELLEVPPRGPALGKGVSAGTNEGGEPAVGFVERLGMDSAEYGDPGLVED